MSKRPDSAMAEQLRKAGVAQWSALAMAAFDALRKHGGKPDAALEDFVAAVTDGADVLVELMGAASVRAAALGYLRSRAADVNGVGGQCGSVAQSTIAPSAETTAGQPIHGAQAKPARPSSTNRSGGGHEIAVAQMTTAAPAREPSPPRRGLQAIESMAAIKRLCVLDTLRWNGKPIGDNTPDEALRTADTMAADVRIVRALCAGVPPTARIRDFIDPQEAERRARIGREAAGV